MLMFTSVVTELTQEGPRHMLILASPRNPGSHFKVEADAGTAARMRAIISTEIKSAAVVGKILGSGNGDDQPHDHPFNRC
jgi:hypothetical protein